MSYPPHLAKLIQVFKAFPGVGARSAERFAFHLLRCPKEQLQGIARLIAQLPEQIVTCPDCGALTQSGACFFCASGKRDPEQICLLALPQELFAMERTGRYKGLYHVLGSFEAKLGIEKLCARVERLGTREVILALDATLEAEKIALEVKHALAGRARLSRIASGIPLGGLLEFADSPTLSCAFEARRSF